MISPSTVKLTENFKIWLSVAYGDLVDGIINLVILLTLQSDHIEIFRQCLHQCTRTHYPFLAETILKVASEIAPDRKLEVIDPAPAVARHLVEVMKEEGLLEKDRVPGFEISLYSSGDDRILKETYETLI